MTEVSMDNDIKAIDNLWHVFGISRPEYLAWKRLKQHLLNSNCCLGSDHKCCLKRSDVHGDFCSAKKCQYQVSKSSEY